MTIYLVTHETHDIGPYRRAFETEQEAKDYVREQQPSYGGMVHVGQGEILCGSLWKIEPIQLGRYEDGS